MAILAGPGSPGYDNALLGEGGEHPIRVGRPPAPPEWRVTFQRMPTNYNPPQVIFVRSDNAPNAIAAARTEFERKTGIVSTECVNWAAAPVVE